MERHPVESEPSVSRPPMSTAPASSAGPGSGAPPWTLALTSAAFFMVALDMLVVITALPAIRREFGASLAALQWTVNAFTLAYASGIITGAALGARFGRRRIFGIGLLIFTAASVACALSATPEQLIAARVVQGIGAAIVMPLSLTILTTAFPPEERGTIVGIWGGVGGLAVASGPLVGGLITQTLGWHWIFWVNVPIGVMATMLVRQKLSESFGPRTRIDLAGVGLVSLGALSLVWGLVRAADTGWTEAMTLGALAVGAISLSAFLAWEARATDPMLPLRLFRSRPFLGANATGFLMIGALSASVFLVAQYFQLGLGYSPMQTGLRLLPWTAMPLVIAPLAGKLSDRIGWRQILSLAPILQDVAI